MVQTMQMNTEGENSQCLGVFAWELPAKLNATFVKSKVLIPLNMFVYGHSWTPSSTNGLLPADLVDLGKFLACFN